MKKRQRGALKRNPRGVPAWFWLLGGILIGLGIALVLMFKGYLPELKRPTADDTTRTSAASALVEDKKPAAVAPKKPRYDFFTVLPEMEVVVPEQELSRRAEPSPNATNNRPESYILQAGSFRNAAEAEQMKARLALLGSVAKVHTVTVNQQTWHRVRIGPFQGARKTDKMRRLLGENKIDTLVMRVKP